jgi:outer membrane protein assembly factor BamE (lipoprotein component of BamABCDE complex)
MLHKCIFIAFGACLALGVQADTLSFEKYRQLREGMSEAQVLLLAGHPDRESTIALYYTFERIWYYIPERGSFDPWITTIRFNAAGKVIQVEREKP